MTKIDPILAVKDVEASARWYQQVFNFRKIHGGNEFAVLVSEDDEISLCLHKWGEHHHPTMTTPDIPSGNGLILYFRTQNMEAIRVKIEEMGGAVEEDIHLNQNSLRKEFSLRDPDGYFLIVSAFHKYEG